MKKHGVISASTVLGLAAMFSVTPVSATEFMAFQLGVYPICTGCHVNGNLNNADKGNLMPAAKTAYRQDPWNLSGLKTFLEASTVPATPTCTGGQVLNTAKDACITPAPTTPTCTGGQVLNPAKTACVTPAPTAPTCTGNQILNATKTACVAKPVTVVTPTPTVTATTNTKPVLNAVAQQWDAKVGETLTIPLSVKDAEQDEFKMMSSMASAKFGKVYTDAKTLLPTIDFSLTPTAKQVNTILTITFQAKETKTTQKLTSNKASIKIRVWAAGSRDAASVTKLNVSTSVWNSGKLNLSGNVVFNNLLTTAERKSFIANKFDLTVSDNNGVLIGSTPLKLDAKGNWSVVIPTLTAPCDIVLEYEGQKAARTVVGCTATSAITSASSFTPFVASRDDDEHHGFGKHDDDFEREHDEHHDDD